MNLTIYDTLEDKKSTIMTVNELYKRDLEKKVPFHSYINHEELYNEYLKAPLIPDFDLYLEGAFPGKVIDSVPEELLYAARNQFHAEIVKGSIPDECKKHNIKQTPTYKNLERLSNTYNLILENIATSSDPEDRTDSIITHLQKLSAENQHLIADHMFTDDSIESAIHLGIGQPNRTDLQPREIIDQRLEDFKNKIAIYIKTIPSIRQEEKSTIVPEKALQEPSKKPWEKILDHWLGIYSDKSEKQINFGWLYRKLTHGQNRLLNMSPKDWLALMNEKMPGEDGVDNFSNNIPRQHICDADTEQNKARLREYNKIIEAIKQ